MSSSAPFRWRKTITWIAFSRRLGKLTWQVAWVVGCVYKMFGMLMIKPIKSVNINKMSLVNGF